MAVTVAAVYAGVDFKSWSVIATADGDTTATITHGFGAAPKEYNFAPILQAGNTSAWFVSSVTASVIELTKSTATGSGTANAQIIVFAKRPHSIGA